MAEKRLLKELEQFKNNKDSNVYANPTEENIFIWNATIKGPKETLYEKGIYKLKLEFSETYPFNPPKVTFLTNIIHPNINYEDGSICLDILKENWSPALSIFRVLLSLSSLLSDPNFDDPLMPTISKLYYDDRNEYNKLILKWVEKYAYESTPI